MGTLEEEKKKAELHLGHLDQVQMALQAGRFTNDLAIRWATNLVAGNAASCKQCAGMLTDATPNEQSKAKEETAEGAGDGAVSEVQDTSADTSSEVKQEVTDVPSGAEEPTV